jgi:hypothetical protein
MRAFRIAMAIVIVICLLPIASLLLSLALASLGNCRVDEGSVHPCVIAGIDLGEALYTMFVLPWLGLLTLPVLAFALLLWAIIELTGWLRRRRRAPNT